MQSTQLLKSISAPLKLNIPVSNCGHTSHTISANILLDIKPDEIYHRANTSQGIIAIRHAPARPRIFDIEVHPTLKIKGQVNEETGKITIVSELKIGNTLEGEALVFDFSGYLSERVSGILYSFDYPFCSRLSLN